MSDTPVVDATAEVVSGTRWGLVSQLGLQLTRLATQVVLTRLLVPDDFGLVTLGFTFVLLLDLLKDLGTVAVLVQRPQVSDALVNTLFAVNVLIGAAFSGLFALAAPVLARTLDDPRATGIFQALGCSLFITSFGLVHQAMLRRQRRFRTIAVVTLSNAVVNSVVSITLAAMDASVWALVIGQLSGAAVGVVVAFRTSGVRIGHARASRDEMRGVWDFGLSLTAFNIFNYLFLNADKIIVGSFLGARALGIYGLGQRVLFYPVRSVTQMLQQVLFPTFARLDDDAIGRGYLRACGGIAFVTFPLMTGVTVTAGPLVRTVFGSTWDDAVPVITILAPVGMLHSLHFTVGALYTAKAKGRALMWWGIGSGVVTVGAYFAGLPFGITGMAATYAVVAVLLTYPAFAIPFRYIGLRVRDLWAAVRSVVLCTSVMAAAVLLVRLLLQQIEVGDATELLVGVGVGGATYVGAVALVRPPALAEVRRMVRRKS
jgi:lipopolysaccharide exporter